MNKALIGAQGCMTSPLTLPLTHIGDYYQIQGQTWHRHISCQHRRLARRRNWADQKSPTTIRLAIYHQAQLQRRRPSRDRSERKLIRKSWTTGRSSAARRIFAKSCRDRHRLLTAFRHRLTSIPSLLSPTTRFRRCRPCLSSRDRRAWCQVCHPYHPCHLGQHNAASSSRMSVTQTERLLESSAWKQASLASRLSSF